MQMSFCTVQTSDPETIPTLSKIWESLNSFQPPIMVGMITTSPSKNMDMISRVAEKGIGVNSRGMYGATKNEAMSIAHSRYDRLPFGMLVGSK